MKRNLIETFSTNGKLEERADYLATEGLEVPADDINRKIWPTMDRLQYELISISATSRDQITGLFRPSERQNWRAGNVKVAEMMRAAGYETEEDAQTLHEAKGGPDA